MDADRAGVSGKVILIVDGSHGLGATISRQLALAGATVVLGSSSPERLGTQVRALRFLGSDARSLVMDVDDDASVAHAIAQVTKSAPIDILVNCWGDLSTNPPPVEGDSAAWINRVTRAVLPTMLERESGLIMQAVIGTRSGIAHDPSHEAKDAVSRLSHEITAEIGDVGVDIIVHAPLTREDRSASEAQLTLDETAHAVHRILERHRRRRSSAVGALVEFVRASWTPDPPRSDGA